MKEEILLTERGIELGTLWLEGKNLRNCTGESTWDYKVGRQRSYQMFRRSNPGPCVWKVEILPAAPTTPPLKHIWLQVNYYNVILYSNTAQSELRNYCMSIVVIPVKLGIIGVMNRSQLDINNRKVRVCLIDSETVCTNVREDHLIFEITWRLHESGSLAFFF